MLSNKLVGTFSSPEEYATECQIIRNNYKDKLLKDNIRVFSLMDEYDTTILEYLYLFNLDTSNATYFRPKDIVLNKVEYTLFTINGLNCLLREKGLNKGDKIDFSEYKHKIISEYAGSSYVRGIRYICKG